MSLIHNLSLCMIAKNEEDFLETALGSARRVLGDLEIIVADTGSIDKTVEIAKKYGAKVFNFKWCDDFSAARNFSVSKARNDWILYIDADEEVLEVDIDELAAFMDDPFSVGAVTRVELTDNISRHESRLYNRKHHQMTGTIHEQITPLGNRERKVINVPVLLAHHGYLPEFERVEQKLLRNEKLLLAELEHAPDDSYILYQLGKSYFCNERDLVKACDYFEKALSGNPNRSLEYVYDTVECYGYALINTGQYKEALDFVVKNATYYADKPQYRFLTAHILQNNGMFVEAVESYESCIGADITDFSGITSYLSYYNIGVILECIEMVDDAILMYKNCGDYEPALLRLAELTT